MVVESLYLLAPIGAVLALVFAYIQGRRVLKADEGPESIKKLSLAIRKGAGAYLKRQYAGVAIFFAAMFIILGIMALCKILTPFVPFAFITGGFFSGLSGFIGMKIATYANGRTTQASTKSLNSGLRVAFSAGSVMGFVVVGLGLLDLAIWFTLLKNVFYVNLVGDAQITAISSAMLTFGMGASSMALFARVGGGIFTKAADVGADLVGKVEAGIPEDDARNPATIADNVGDNVGDVAGMGADLYESYVGSIVATMALAVASGLGFAGAAIPMILAAVGTIASIIGTFFVRTKENISQRALLAALRTGTYIAAGLIVVVAIPIVYFVLGPGNFGVYFAIISGLLAGVIIGAVTEYYTSDTYKPTKKLSDAAKTGPATIIISGMSLGMLSTVIPVIVVCASVLVSFFVSGGAAHYEMGLYGVGISAVGMLSTLGITLATDAYGPVADNAGGIAQMSHQDPIVRERTDALDSLGNTTAATGKGFAIGSAALTALALIVAYIDEVKMKPGFEFDPAQLALNNPEVLIGLFIGAMIPFLFASLTMSAVGRAAQSIVYEVRRQFKEILGIMEGTAEPEYAKCVALCTKAAQKEMIAPALLAIVVPIVVGLILGVYGVVGFLAGTVITGFVLAIMMANAGGAWDNAKKYIEAGNHGGRGSEAHKAGVVGDTVGDPFKDTAGPSINILIKLTSMVSIVFAGLIVNVHIL